MHAVYVSGLDSHDLEMYTGGLSGSDAAHVLGQASLSPMLEGEGSIPIRDVGFSQLMRDTDKWAGCRGFFQGTPVCSPSLRYLQNKI